jgi:cytoskeletal protein CcmA (bactofilin family)
VNHQPDTDFDEGSTGPVDHDGRPIDPPVLSMEQAVNPGPSESVNVALPDLSLATPTGTVVMLTRTPPSAQALESLPRQFLANVSGKTVMPKGWSLTGDIESSDAVTIGCQVQGQIELTSSSRLEVLHGASVVGAIKGLDVVIRGFVEGEINAGGGSLSIEDGATILGKVSYTGIRMSGGEHQMELVHVPRAAIR